MEKPDLKAGRLAEWESYRDKPIETTCSLIYNHAERFSADARQWYWTSIKTKRNTSLGIRGVTFSMLIVGTVLPVFSALWADISTRLACTQIGVGVLALAGLLQIADRVFGWSSGWMRYVTTVTSMEILTRRFELEWASYMLTRGGKLDQADVRHLFDLARRFEDDIAQAQRAETERWVTEFNAGMALLGDLIKTQRESNEKALEAARTAAAAKSTANQISERNSQAGSLEVNLVHGGIPVPVTISLDEEPGGTFCGSSWCRPGVTPGHHVVTVVTRQSPPQRIQKVVDVVAGGVERLEIKLP